MKERVTPENITSLKDNEIFVFGSNLAGIHGAGAAKIALLHFGAIWNEGVGLHGQSYAIPTKDDHIKTMPLSKIKFYVNDFINYAQQHDYLTFYVTKIGCGLAGYKPKDIAPLFKDAMYVENIFLPEEFWDIINPS